MTRFVNECNIKLYNNAEDIMRTVGTVRKLGAVGRIVLPAKLRHSRNINPGDHIEIFSIEGRICLRKSEPKCIFCGGAHDMEVHLEKYVCNGYLKVLVRRKAVEVVAYQLKV